MCILAIDTISKYSGVALMGGAKIIPRSASAALGVNCFGYKELLWETRQNHSQELLTKIKELLGRAKVKHFAIKAVAVVSGPGSFTGTRIGVTVANSIGFALKIPVVGVDALTAQAMFFTHFCSQGGEELKMGIVSVLEINREQLYLKKIKKQKPKSENNIELVDINKLGNFIEEGDLIIGETTEYLAEIIKQMFPRNEIKFIANFDQNHRALGAAKVVAELWGAKKINPKTVAVPIYIKPANITKKKK